MTGIGREPQFAIGQRAPLLRSAKEHHPLLLHTFARDPAAIEMVKALGDGHRY